MIELAPETMFTIICFETKNYTSFNKADNLPISLMFSHAAPLPLAVFLAQKSCSKGTLG